MQGTKLLIPHIVYATNVDLQPRRYQLLYATFSKTPIIKLQMKCGAQVELFFGGKHLGEYSIP